MSTHETPNERLKHIRQLLKLTRGYIQDKYGISADSLLSWENGRSTLTEKGIDRCLKAYKGEGILVSKEWILRGEGLSPKFSVDLGKYFKEQAIHCDNEIVDDEFLKIKEIDFFKSLSSNAIAAMITSEEMLPLYSPGDYVAGRCKSRNDLDQCIGKDCIIKITDFETLVIRRIASNSDGNGYNLVILNPSYSGSAEPVFFNADIEYAAPIIWIRRSD